MFDALKQKYYNDLSEIAHSTRELTPEEIIAKLDPDRVTEVSFAYRMRWIDLFILLRADSDLREPSITNIRRAMEALGVTAFMENRLIYGQDSEKLRVIQAARLLEVQLPDCVMAGIVNNRNVRLRKAARFYYMLTNRDDPYPFFANDKMNASFPVWDKLELHQLFEDCVRAGKKLPSFIPLIRQLSDPRIAAFFIRETAYWGSDGEVRFLLEYFDSPDLTLREAAFEGVGLRRFAEAEEALKNCFFKQPEHLRRVILESLLTIRSGASSEFFREVFLDSASQFTRRTALYCLWRYDDRGRALFAEMKRSATADDLVLFNHVERITSIQ